MLDYSILWGIGWALAIVAFYGGMLTLVILGVYFLLRVASKPMAGVLSHYALSQEKKTISRLLSPDSREYVSKGIQNEEQLAGLIKSIAARNGWKSEDVANIPAWLLTGHLVVDANPNLPYEFSKRDNGYRETDMN